MGKETMPTTARTELPDKNLEAAMKFSEHGREKKKRSPAEVQDLKDRLRFVAKLISKNIGLNLIPGQNWAAGLSKKFEEERRKHPDKSLEEFDGKLLMPEVMTYPEQELLERDEDYIFGVLRHEIGHIKHSDYQSLLESQSQAKAEGYKPMDLFMIYDAWEDGRSNEQEGRTSKTAKRRLGQYLSQDIGDAMLHDFAEKPLPIQYGLLCWAKGAEPFIDGFDFEDIKAKIKDERVLKAYDETESVLQEYLHEQKGRKAFTDIMWQKGWPVFKDLIDKYIEEEAQKQQSQEGQGQQGEEQQPGQEGSQKKDQKPEGQDSQESSDQQKDGQQDDQEKQSSQSQGQEPKKNWDDLSEEEKEQYRQAAREKLTEEEREFVKKLQPQSVQITEKSDGTFEIEVQEVTPEDVAQAEQADKESEKREQERQQQIQQARSETKKDIEQTQEKLRERMTGLTDKEREQYGVYYNGIKKYVDMLVQRLDEVFPPEQEAELETGFRRGKKIDTKRLAREIPTQEGRFFSRKEVPEIKAVAFTLLIDVSGSMQGQKIKEALKAAILMAEAFSRKGVPFEILAFHDQLLELKGFDEKYFGKKKLEIMRVLREVNTPNANWNDDGFAVDSAARRLQKKLLADDASGALIVFSDGQPAPGSAHNGPEWELHDIVRKWSNQIPLIGVGIGPGMEKTIKEYYDKNGLPVPDISQLPQALLRILSKQIERFESKSS